MQQRKSLKDIIPLSDCLFYLYNRAVYIEVLC